MRYCSFETRKVLDTLDEYGIDIADSYIHVEQDVGRFWNTHITGVIKQITKASNVESAMAGGWAWFHKPIVSMLTPRGGAQRTDSVDITITEHVEKVYNLVTSSLCLTDFNMKELELLTVDIPPMVPDVSSLARAIMACKAQNNRSIYYLHGVVRRDYQTTQGRVREIQQQTAETEDRGWVIPETYDKMDITERRALESDWQDRLNSITIGKALNDVR